jgi:hypothetical protein
MMALKEYCRQHFQDMESIIQDLMLITEKPAYVSYEEPILDAADLRGLDEATDPLGIHKQTVLMVYKTKLAAYMKKLDKQLLDKGSAYRVIRSMCSPQLNAILVVDPNFIAVKKTDPLALLAAIKNVVTSRCDGNIELERAEGLVHADHAWWRRRGCLRSTKRETLPQTHEFRGAGGPTPKPKISVTSIHRWTDQLEFDILRLQELPQQ